MKGFLQIVHIFYYITLVFPCVVICNIPGDCCNCLLCTVFILDFEQLSHMRHCFIYTLNSFTDFSIAFIANFEQTSHFV